MTGVELHRSKRPRRHRRENGPQGDLLDIFTAGTEQLVHKWHHCIPIYERYFGPWCKRPLRFLKIGVFKGGSLSMWRRYFGPEAVIYGIDIDPSCAADDVIGGQVRIGSQDDPDFFACVVAETGGVDVVHDDSSHTMPHIGTTFEALFPQISPRGLYMGEDLHTACWRSYCGGYNKRAKFMNYIRGMSDDLHQSYHDHEPRHGSVSRHCPGLHIHDSIVVIDRAGRMQPTHSRITDHPA